MADTSYSLLLTCLARQILRDYPGVKRSEFYQRWQNRHGLESLCTLRGFIDREYSQFRGWCAVLGLLESYSNIAPYLQANPVRVLPSSEPLLALGLQTDSVDPWWSDLPWLAPKGVNHV